MRYTSQDKLRSGVPLGGIGAGKIEILPNGTLDFFTFANNFDNPTTDNPHPDKQRRSIAKGVIGCHFGVSCQHKDKRISKLLQTVKISDCPCIKRIEFEGLFPFARIKYCDDELPCRVSLEAFSPFIPSDSKNSLIPVAMFEFTIANPLKEKIDVSLFASARNTVGNWCVGRYNGIEKNGLLTTLNFKKKRPLTSDYTNGVFAMSIPNSCGDISYSQIWNLQTECFKWDREHIVLKPWKDFSEHGALANDNAVNTVESENFQAAGALCCRINLAPMAAKKIRVIYSWHFPHKERSHIYERYFKDAEEPALFLEKNYKQLKNKILRWHKSVFNLKIPHWLKDAAINNMYVYHSAGWWDKKNGFAISEAPCEIALMGTLDVRYYDSIARALFFPDIEKRELLQFAKAQRKDGYIPHDLGKARLDSPSNGTTFYLWRDLNPKFILMAYRNFLWHKDKTALKALYPHIKKAFKWISSTDKNRDFLPDNAGLDQTFDVWEFHGTNAYTSGIFLASLLALERIAAVMGDKRLSNTCRFYFKKARESFQNQLWNGNYFIACNGPKGKDGACTLGQLNGQWYAHLLGLGYIVDKYKVRRAIKSVLSLNAKDTKFGATNSVLSDGKRDLSSLQSKNLWAGEIYAFCALAIYEGFKKEGLALARRMWDNIAERQLSPWDQPDMLDPDTGEYLFGDHYMRNMVIWSLLLALKKTIK